MNSVIGPLLEEGQSKDIPGWKALYKRSTLSNPDYIAVLCKIQTNKSDTLMDSSAIVIYRKWSRNKIGHVTKCSY